MTAREGAIALRLERRVLDILRSEGFVVADNATQGLFAELPITPKLSGALVSLASSVILLRKVYFTDRARVYELTDEAYMLRAWLENAGVDREKLNDLIGKIRELTLEDSLQMPQRESQPNV